MKSPKPAAETREPKTTFVEAAVLAVLRPKNNSNRCISMKKNPLNKGMLTNNSTEIGPVTPGLVQTRARELALMAGRPASEVSPADLAQAERELTGGPDLDRLDAVLEALPETKRWDPVPGSEGQQAPESPSEDEDDEGRSETEQLVEEGAEEADRDRMLQAARLARKNK